ncbi:unnamed protein product, partial [Closterium sp. NIES-65]
ACGRPARVPTRGGVVREGSRKLLPHSGGHNDGGQCGGCESRHEREAPPNHPLLPRLAL